MRPIRGRRARVLVAGIAAVIVAAGCGRSADREEVLPPSPSPAPSPSPVAVTPDFTLSPEAVPPTGEITLAGEGFAPLEGVDVFVDDEHVARATAGEAGRFPETTIRVPAGAAPGTHWLTLIGEESGGAAQQPFTVRTDWPQLGFDAARSGHNPYENVLGPETVGDLEVAWRARVKGQFLGPEPYARESGPVLAGGTIFVGSTWSRGEEGGYSLEGRVTALNATSGETLWSRDIGTGVSPFPSAMDGLVYVAPDAGSIHALDATTGTTMWRKRFGRAGSIADPETAVADGVVYVTVVAADEGGERGALYALEGSTGDVLWRARTDERLFSPAASGGVVYAAGRPHAEPLAPVPRTLYAFDAEAGAGLWARTMPTMGWSLPLVADDAVYVESACWAHQPFAECPSPALARAFDAATGEVVWKRRATAFVEGLAESDGLVIAATSPAEGGLRLAALDASTGAPGWVSGAAYGCTPAVANGVVYGFGSRPGGGELSAVDASTGATLWRRPVARGEWPAAGVMVANGMLYLWSGSRISAFSLPEMPPEPPRPDPTELAPSK